MPTSRPAQTARLAVTASLGALVLAGCSGQAVQVDVAPHATDPDCARVVLALPSTLGGAGRLTTTSQATRAWGSRTSPIVLRCGVEPLGPTTDTCVHAEDAAGRSVDWVTVEGADGWTFTTYGRDPAVEVHVPKKVTDSQSTSFLVDLGPAIELVAATRHCV